MTDVGVEPYWELMFDAEGDVDPGGRDALIRGVVDRGLTDLVVFAHGWNNSRSLATGLYRRFFAPFPAVFAECGDDAARLGYGGVIWPSMRFTDEPVPDFPDLRPALTGDGPALEPGTLEALAAVFPGSEALLDRLAELIERRPADPARLEEFASLVRRLVGVPGPGAATGAEDPVLRGVLDDVDPEPGASAAPAMLTESPRAVCERFAEAVVPAGSARAELFGGLGRLWSGALELLRQGSYWEMKRRAGQVGQQGLGPLLGELAEASPGLRVHLVGHSFGGRLVAFAVRGLPERAQCVHSLVLLQGAFSHYAFAPRLPFAQDRSGVLKDLHRRVAGPVVCCHSRHDLALSLLYPLASRMSGDTQSALGLGDARWGAMGHDGVQAVTGTGTLELGQALAGPLPESGCVNVDVAAVVRRGGPPSGAHSDICHGELARLVLVAGRLVRPSVG
ncbi:serine-threonine protein kinase [Streptomyces sp. SCA3-4]|uniref:alpha/beta fold hydrolase n=1 Tax=Streptomyces sichuanensis TaxID=2871810 RepID=UPI001CE27278|nr:serine-threonine protein kinase [Streptomyces sichuanensis]MCA6095717.1 serine-threonine protein kinase [Streptomyces sichuanensis]